MFVWPAADVFFFSPFFLSLLGSGVSDEGEVIGQRSQSGRGTCCLLKNGAVFGKLSSVTLRWPFWERERENIIPPDFLCQIQI